MKLEDLKAHIYELDSITNEEWINSLSDRKLKELQFHDKDRDLSRLEACKSSDTYDKFYGNKKYYKTTQRSFNYKDQWIASNCKDKIFLDFACGNGNNALLAARSGAKLSIGFDISRVSVENARKNAEDLDNIIFFQADAENTKLPNDSVDTIICSGMLHHLDLSYALPELRRILKPKGKILAIEALDYNPIIKLYRKFTPNMRTEWEKAHILDFNDLKFASRFFAIGETRFWHLLGYLSAKVRFIGPILETLDILLEKIPLIRRLSWIFTFELIKEDYK